MMMQPQLGVVGLLVLVVLVLLGPTGCTARTERRPQQPQQTGFGIGAGVGDSTGPIAQVAFMGYAAPNQTGGGLHLRQFARAVVLTQGDAARVAIVNVDVCMTFYNVKDAVIRNLAVALNSTTVYTHANVLISSIHTHSGPAGFSTMMLYNTVTYGYVNETADAVARGITDAILAAHKNVQEGGRVRMASGELRNASINRSPYSYLQNPEAERALYDADVDYQHTVLRYDDASGSPVALQSVFAVHCTSMPNTNQLVSSDNKGIAALLTEKWLNNANKANKNSSVVAQFLTSNEGDVSPNVLGTFCYGLGGPACDFKHSTCNNRSQQCHGYGPGGYDWFASAQEIGRRQADHAQQLWQSAGGGGEVTGYLRYGYTTVDMENVTVLPPYTSTNRTERTCVAAMGMSFAAGTTDGPGDFNFVQGDNSSASTPFWDVIRDLLEKPTPQEIACQAPKPIFLNVGDFKKGTLPGLITPTWAPKVVPLQIVLVGSVAFVGCPGEFTTMAGRRLRNTVEKAFADNGMPGVTALILGLTNQYTGYITTYEEFQVQRYEAASTLFGPHTLAAYEQEFSKLAAAVATNTAAPTGPAVPAADSPSLLPPPKDDRVPVGKHFGQVVTDVKPAYSSGEVANVTFWGANPRHRPATWPATFLSVERQSGTEWQVVYTDADIETRFYWHHVPGLLNAGESQVSCAWFIPKQGEVVEGTYRIRYFGNHKQGDAYTPFTGTSASFTVAAAAAQKSGIDLTEAA